MRAAAAACLDEVRAVEGRVSARARFPADLPVFAGHFPGRPLVPGVLLLEAARGACERALALRLELREVEEAKLLRPLLPDEGVALEATLEAAPEGWRCEAALVGAQGEVARMRLFLARGT